MTKPDTAGATWVAVRLRSANSQAMLPNSKPKPAHPSATNRPYGNCVAIRPMPASAIAVSDHGIVGSSTFVGAGNGATSTGAGSSATLVVGIVTVSAFAASVLVVVLEELA